jgi:RND family efflux transporter MFP subunit
MKKIILFYLLGPLSLFATEIYATFDVEGVQDSKLTLPVSGVVKTLHVSISERIKKDQILLELENSEEFADYELSKSDLKLAEISQEQAQIKMDRYQKIKNVLDQERYENIEFEYKKAKQSYVKSQNALNLKKTKLNKKILRAPYDGVVTDLHVELGDGVSGPATPLVSISSFPKVKLILSFDEKYWNSVKVGQTFKYSVDGIEKNFEGKITKVYPSVNPNTRKLKAEVYTQDILPGLFGDGKIVVE